MIAIIAACSGLLVYIFLLGAAYAGLGKIKRKTASEPLRKNLFISVIVCARNEEKNIGVCLESLFNQDYGIENYEVIVVDDCSEDSTPEIVEKSKSLSETALKKVMTPENCPWKSRKKFALNTGIKAAQGEILAFTDADALVESGWLSSIASEYLSGTNINAVSGLTVLKERAEKGLAGKILSLEFIGLGLIGGGLISSGIPVLANGNNFSYRKEIFNKSGGFSGIENITSGDDDLLLQKFSKDPGFTAVFNCDKKGVVFTNGPESFRQFLNQRARWASKGLLYNSPILKTALLLVYYMFIFLFVFPVAAFYSEVYGLAALLIFGFKMAADSIFLYRALGLCGRRDLLFYLFPAEILHIPYIVYSGAAGAFGGFRWK